MLKAGQVVNIYQKPTTREDFEGKAILIELLKSNDEMEYWDVTFCNTSDDTDTFERWVLKEKQ